jgi:hypothetical protein
MRQKKAQTWGFDLMIATIIFISGIVAFYIYSINYPSEGQDKIDSLSYEGEIIGENLLTSGYPGNWNESNVILIGIVDAKRINDTKLELFHNFTNFTLNPNGYNLSKAIFNTKYEYFINFSKQVNISSGPIAGIGLFPDGPTNLVKVARITVYKNQTITMSIYIWEE